MYRNVVAGSRPFHSTVLVRGRRTRFAVRLVFMKNFEDQIEELNQSDTDDYIDCDLQPPPRFLRPTQQISDVVGGLMQSLSQLLEVLNRTPHLLGDSRHCQRRICDLLSIAKIEFGLAR